MENLLASLIAGMIESKRYRDNIAADIENGEKPSVLLREFTDFEIAQMMVTFLFASQDA